MRPGSGSPAGTAQYYNNLGYSYLLRGDTATALINLRKASQLDPQNLTIANNLKMLATAAKQPRPRRDRAQRADPDALSAREAGYQRRAVARRQIDVPLPNRREDGGP